MAGRSVAGCGATLDRGAFSRYFLPGASAPERRRPPCRQETFVTLPAWDCGHARAVLHVDMDAFYASVEVLDDPALRGRPVIVGGTPEGRGVVAAASYEARRFGVRSAMTAARARQLCPEGVFLHPRPDRYFEVSCALMAILRGYTPLVEPLSIDEAFLDVSGCRRLLGTPPEIAADIKRRVRAETGLTASVGVAANKFLAKLASDLEKPDGLVVIEPATGRERIAGLPIERLWGVGRVTSEQFRAAGLACIGDLLRRDPAELEARFGPHVHHLVELAAGRDDRPVVPAHEAKSVGNEVTFAEDIGDAAQLRAICDELSDKVARRLRADALRARTVVLKARYPDFTTHTRSMTLDEPTDGGVEIRDAARELLERKLDRGRRPLRLVGVTAANLVHGRKTGQGTGQGSLFADPGRARNQQLDRVLDQVSGRFGPLLKRGARPRSGSDGA
jgi:DNA polymerase-4